MTIPQMCQYKSETICPNAAIFGEILKSVRMELDDNKKSAESAIAQNRNDFISTVTEIRTSSAVERKESMINIRWLIGICFSNFVGIVAMIFQHLTQHLTHP